MKPVEIDEVWGVVSVVKPMEVPEFRECKYPAKAVVESGSEPSVGGSSVPANPAVSITKNKIGQWPEVSLCHWQNANPFPSSLPTHT